jgi:hypothetical protein
VTSAPSTRAKYYPNGGKATRIYEPVAGLGFSSGSRNIAYVRAIRASSVGWSVALNGLVEPNQEPIRAFRDPP